MVFRFIQGAGGADPPPAGTAPAPASRPAQSAQFTSSSAAKCAGLLGEAVPGSARKNLEMRVEAENGKAFRGLLERCFG